MKKLISIWLISLLVISSFAKTFGFPATKESKNILLINSYHQGFAWTDSLTNGIIKVFREQPEIKLYIEYLNSKQFGRTQFEHTSNYFQKKYDQIPFDGVLVTDNDALDFALQIDQDFFPNAPVVFAGISNPEDYVLEKTNYYGLKESGNTEGVLDLIISLFPKSKTILVITDETTTGKIYRENFIKQQFKFPDLRIQFPKVMDKDSICSMVSVNSGFDIIFYIGVNQDRYGNSVDNVLLLEHIGRLAKVPLFSNDPLYIGKGVIGGLYQSGSKHGSEAAKLLFQLVGASNRETLRHLNELDKQLFFDRKWLDRFDIPVKRLPKGVLIANNQHTVFNETNFTLLITVLLFLILVIVLLTFVNRKRKHEHLKSENQLREIEIQRNQLEGTSKQLNMVISELEKTNNKLNETNASLLVAKKKAEESDNLKSAFLANVSHEIRTPLNSIVGFSSLMVDSDLSEEKRSMYSDLIESNSESLLVLIDEIIDLSKIEAQQLTITKQYFSIDVLVFELFQVFKNSHKNSQVELRMAKISEESELFVFSDRVRVKQIFINLLSNAYKFTEHNYIEFGYRFNESNEIQFYVKDSGIGIKEEHHQVIFDRFRKLNNENGSKVYAGTGLGLAITQRLVELLGGKIWIVSEPGKGATFFFTLAGTQLEGIKQE